MCPVAEEPQDEHLTFAPEKLAERRSQLAAVRGVLQGGVEVPCRSATVPPFGRIGASSETVL
jgi:hypothetical protein